MTSMGEDLFRLDGNSAAGVLQEVFAPEMTTASCTCASCRRVSAIGALYLYGGTMGCVLRCPSCEAIVLCVTSVPAGHFIQLYGVVRVSAG
jgi:hypothetical protein